RHDGQAHPAEPAHLPHSEDLSVPAGDGVERGLCLLTLHPARDAVIGEHSDDLPPLGVGELSQLRQLTVDRYALLSRAGYPTVEDCPLLHSSIMPPLSVPR